MGGFVAEARQPIPRRIRILVVVLVSALFLLSIMNLVLVSEKAAAVRPEGRPPRDWRVGLDAVEGRETWTYQVTTNDRAIVDLDIHLPYTISKTQVRGEAELATRVTYHMDGIVLAQEERSFFLTAPPPSNETVSRSSSEQGTFGFGDDPLVVDIPEGLESFVLLVTWDWRLTASPDAELSFRVQAGELTVQPRDTGGLPWCNGVRCSRLFVVLTFVAQAGAFVWFSQAPSADGKPAWHRRQARLEKHVTDFDVDEPGALPRKRRNRRKAPPK